MLKHEIAVASPSIWTRIKALRTDDECLLAPGFRRAVDAMKKDWAKTSQITHKGKKVPFDPDIFETQRKNELQKIYFSQGTTRAEHAFWSWHFYGLAIDVISKSMEWSAPPSWWDLLGTIAEHNSLDWGGRWAQVDLPHIQFGNLAPRPKNAPYIYFDTKTIKKWEPFADPAQHQEGLERVWKAVRAQ